MATGPASRNSTASESNLDLAFLTLSTDCETWLTGPDDDVQNPSESISTQEWLDGALKNSQYDHTKLHRIMQSQKKPFLAPEIDNDSDGEEFFDAETNFKEETGTVATWNDQNPESTSKTSPRNPNISNVQRYGTQNSPNISNINSQASPRGIVNSNNRQNIYKVSPRVSKDQSKQLSVQNINGSKVSPRRENSVPNDKTSPKPNVVLGTSKIPAVNNTMSKSGLRPPTISPNNNCRQQNANISPQFKNVETTKNINDNNGCGSSFLEMSRKIEEQEKKLREEALQGKKHESRPSSSASTNGEIVVKEESVPSANIPTSKSVDFKGVLRLNAGGRSTSTRIPMYGRTASVSSTLHRIPKPRPNIMTKALPPSPKDDTSNDPWGDNCF
uniref:Uncharacterized protein n=1 Tax=Panagrolaimus sp. ES5 TaxID=591445 RepID=A0AC34GPW6_9BILA